MLLYLSRIKPENLALKAQMCMWIELNKCINQSSDNKNWRRVQSCSLATFTLACFSLWFLLFYNNSQTSVEILLWFQINFTLSFLLKICLFESLGMASSSWNRLWSEKKKLRCRRFKFKRITQNFICDTKQL